MTLFNRQDNQTHHEKSWRAIHPAIKRFFTRNPYAWIDTTGNLPTPGAEAFAFAKQMLPIIEWKGPGEVVQKQLYGTAPQVFVQQTAIQTGIPGIGAGQIWNGGLIDNPAASGDLSGGIV